MARATVSAGFARGVVALAVAKGVAKQVLLARAGLRARDLEDQDARLAFERFVALIRAATSLASAPAFALHFGEAYGLDELSIVGLLTRGCPTPVQAFAQVNRYHRLNMDVDLGGGQGQRLALVRERGECWLVDTRANPDEVPELTEAAFARMASRMHRRGWGRFLRAATFTHGEPPYRAEYDRIFRIPLAFSTGRNAIQIDEAFFQLRFPPSNQYVFGVLSERAEALLKRLQATDTLRGRLEALLARELHTGTTTMEWAARELGVSRPTLFRHLEREGTSFSRVLDALRHRLALDYLEARRVSVNEAAFLVGFSDPASFSRAFKRWTGKSPRAHVRARRRR